MFIILSTLFWSYLCLINAITDKEAQMINAMNAIDSNYNLDNELKNKVSYKEYRPNWEDFGTRPLPEWYDRAKIGILLHWGVYSVPSFGTEAGGSEWFWNNWNANDTKYVDFMKKNYRPGFTYQDFSMQFTAEFFDADEWAKFFVKTGAKYIILTSKHHDGYALFPSKRSFGWNSVESGPHRDIVRELSEAVRKQKLVFGVYHSLLEWFNPIYLEDKLNLFNTQKYVEEKLWPDLKQLVEDYNPSVIWSDGDWDALDTYWNSTDFIAWLYNGSPVKDEIVVNDRWGIGVGCNHGDFFNCEYSHSNTLQPHKWENAFTIDSKSWGYRRNIDVGEILCINHILKEVVTTVSCGGNALINIGPTKDGTINPLFQERLLDLGKWLKVNGEAIYGTSPWHHQNDTLNGNVWYTCVKSGYNGFQPTAPPSGSDTILAVYVIILKWPVNAMVEVKDLTPYLKKGTYNLSLLGNEKILLSWKETNGKTRINLPPLGKVKSKNAWVIKMSPKK